eukprot:306366-Chlamydomonas_euryale.AAC.8
MDVVLTFKDARRSPRRRGCREWRFLVEACLVLLVKLSTACHTDSACAAMWCGAHTQRPPQRRLHRAH